MKLGKFFSLLLLLVSVFACSQPTPTSTNEEETIIQEDQELSPKPQHPYGGWSCPDNLLGFPAVNLEAWDKVPVINGRLPTKEETQSGISLMYFDTTKTPDAKPLNLKMPRLARHYSTYTKKNELVVVIQAVVVDQDTVVGFRNLNGGNGSAWFSEVNFLSDTEISKLKPSSFVSINTEINAPKTKIWGIITNPQNAKTLGKVFVKKAKVGEEWKENSTGLEYNPNSSDAKGLTSAFWDNLYVQVDYNIDGIHSVEKILLVENKESGEPQMHVLIGPFSENIEKERLFWANWLQKVKELSEKKD
jgi:hypothetical protein